MGYIKIKNGSTTKQYTLTNAHAKPYLRVSNSYLPLTEATTAGFQLRVKTGNKTYRAMEYKSSSTSTTYNTTSTSPGAMSNTTALTCESIYSYETCSSTYGTTDFTYEDTYDTVVDASVDINQGGGSFIFQTVRRSSITVYQENTQSLTASDGQTQHWTGAYNRVETTQAWNTSPVAFGPGVWGGQETITWINHYYTITSATHNQGLYSSYWARKSEYNGTQTYFSSYTRDEGNPYKVHLAGDRLNSYPDTTRWVFSYWQANETVTYLKGRIDGNMNSIIEFTQYDLYTTTWREYGYSRTASHFMSRTYHYSSGKLISRITSYLTSVATSGTTDLTRASTSKTLTRSSTSGYSGVLSSSRSTMAWQ